MQWDRYLLSYLAGFTVKSCADVCHEVGVLFCESCPANDQQCLECHACLDREQIQRYNIRDGTCISGFEYGILTGFGFTVLYLVGGLIAGRYGL